MARLFRWLSATAILALLAGAALIALGMIELPSRFDPTAPLDIRDPPNFLTRLKLARLEGDAPRCLAVLDRSDVAHVRVPDQVTGAGCGFSGAVRVARSGVSFGSDFVATCPLMVAWSLFETHVLMPSARRSFGEDVSRVRHLGSYACRNIDHRESGRRSEHATANALDVAGFVLSDGTRIDVATDWRTGTRKAAWLAELRRGACRFFDVVLGPDYNEAHRDHFHLDMGRFRACR